MRTLAFSLALFSLSIVAAPSGNALTSFYEGWATCTSSWAVSGSSATCDFVSGVPSPSLHLDPDGGGVRVRKDPSVVSLMRTEISFAFKASGTDSDTDSGATFRFANGEQVSVIVTEGVSPNNGYTICTSTGGCDVWFATWPTAGLWYTVRVSIDHVAGTAQAFTPQGASAVRSIQAGPAVMTQVEFSGIEWTPRAATTYNYDELVITGV